MKKTKQIILDTALDLFNSEGLSNITLRTIANKMKISQGNLNYHFKKRENIIETLYFQLVENIDRSILKVKVEESQNVLATLITTIHNTTTDFYKYRFFLLDFVQIMRENKKIRNHYKGLSSKREEQFSIIFNLLIENNLMRKEILPNEYKYLFKRLSILCNFWISDAEVQKTKITKKTISTYSVILIHTIYPYLTLKGQKEYTSIISNDFNNR